MTHFGIAGLAMVFVLVVGAIVKADDATVRNALLLLAAVLLGAVIAVEARK